MAGEPKDAPIRLGVCGLGRAFSLMLPTFLADPRIRLAGACDPRPAARAQFAGDFGVPVHEDIEALASDPQVEAIYIASPHQFHAAHTAVAARHGKHVLVEKPMALSVADCDAMIEAARAAEVTLIVGHCHSFDTPYLVARRLIGERGLGQVRMIHALDYTDFLYRPRRPEELRTEEGGGVVYSQAAHQVDIARLMAGSNVTGLRATLGRWDASRPTEGAYACMLWFESGAFASLTYSGYGRFDSDEWNGWIGEMGQARAPDSYGAARRRLAGVGSPDAEARLKNEATYGGPAYQAPSASRAEPAARHQHFGPLIVSCEGADLRPTPAGVWIYGDERREFVELPPPAVPRAEVIDELWGALRHGEAPLHNGPWARETLAVCRAMLESAQTAGDVRFAATMPASSDSH